MSKYLNSVSRNLETKNRAWDSIIYQAGHPILDSELNLAQDLKKSKLLSLPSGILSHSTRERDTDFIFTDPSDPNFSANTFTIRSFKAKVGDMEVHVSGTESSDPLLNVIELPAPSATQGLPPDTKRTDFLFLEVWKAEVSPFSPTTVKIEINSFNAGGIITIDCTDPSIGGNSVNLTEGVEFNLGGTDTETARNISDAINLANFGTSITSSTKGTNHIFLTLDTLGTDGNNVVYSSTSAGFTVSQVYQGTDGVGKPSQDPTKIFYEGNTLSDSSLWLTDDILDPQAVSNTTRRIQVQYRFRVHSVDYDGVNFLDGVNPKTQFYGFDNLNIFAQGGESSPVQDYFFSRADLTNYARNNGTNSYPYKDNGLFYSGDGSQQSATDLGSIDGYVYAIPICYIFRRNTGTFHTLNGVNNGLLTTHAGVVNTSLGENIQAGESDRVDGLFSDQVSDVDLYDLRRFVFPYGKDLNSELKYQTQKLLDNSLRTWAMDGSDLHQIGSGSGDISTTPLVCDEIGRSQALGGEGQTNRGNYIRNFDHVCTRFSSTPTIHRLVLQISTSQTVGTPLTQYGGAISIVSAGANEHSTFGWFQGDEITLDLTQLDVSTDHTWSVSSANAPIGFDSVVPTGTKVIDVEGFHNVGSGSQITDQRVLFSKVEGLGSNTITLTLDYNRRLHDFNFVDQRIVGDSTVGDNGGQTEIYLTFIVEYPSASGLSSTPTEPLTPNTNYYAGGSYVISDQTQNPSPIVSGTDIEVLYRKGIREVHIDHVSGLGTVGNQGVSGKFQFSNGIWSYDNTKVILPYKAFYDGTNPADYEITITDNANNSYNVDYANSTVGSTQTELVFQNPWVATEQRKLSVSFYRKTPIPNYGASGFQMGLYYRTVAPMTCGSKGGLVSAPNQLEIRVLSSSETMYVLQSGAGSSSQGYPYINASDQIGVNPNVADFNGEEDLLGSLNVSIANFNSDTGMIQLPILIPFDTTQNIILGGGSHTPLKDVESRVVYPMLSSDYLAGIFSEPLISSVLHKNVFSLLARVEESSDLFREGEVVLVVFSRLSGAGLTKENQITFSENDIRTVASVYRVESNILLGE
jgi:hypothetical protein